MIAIIPARSGSTGLPGKNIKDFHGKPLIAYSVIEAMKSNYIDEVIVSTDSKEISKIACDFGALCPFLRPDYLAGNDSSAIDNYVYTINRLNQEYGYAIDKFIVLQPTSPLRIVNDINGAIELFTKKNADSVVSYTKENHPITWHKYIDKEGLLEMIFKDNLRNRQKNRVSYYPNGAIYVFKIDLIKKGEYYSAKSFAYIMPAKRSIDIDEQFDFELAEYLYSKKDTYL